jgi:hypothetical protein
MWEDPVVEEVRKARQEHAARFDFDLERIYLDLKAKERLSGHKYVTLQPKRPVNPGPMRH